LPAISRVDQISMESVAQAWWRLPPRAARPSIALAAGDFRGRTVSVAR